ncbi:efflux RND transporter periplasmic adaptor subunit, partial [Methylobacterium sp. WL7]
VGAGAEGGHVVRMRPVTIFRQTGTMLELRTGLTGGERVVVGPPASLRDGDPVALRPEGKAGT